jgi:hypothetical protein
MKPTKQFDQLKAEFYEALHLTKDGLIKAGKTLLKLVEIEPDTYELLIAETPSLRADWLETLERIGRNPEMAELLLADTYAASKALRLTSDKDIKRVVTEPLPVVEVMPDGGMRTVLKRLPEFTRQDADQVFKDGKILQEEQQTNVIQEKAKRQAENDLRYWITGDEIIFRERAKFKIQALHEKLGRMLEEMKPRIAEGLQEEIKKRQIAG